MLNINSKQDLINLLSEPSTKNEALIYLQNLVDEQYNYDIDGKWKLLSNSGGLFRIGIERSEAISLGAVDTIIQEPEKNNIDEIKKNMCYQIDALAELKRQLIITPGAGQMASYQTKEEQAKNYINDPSPTEKNYPDIYNEVGITADTALGVANSIISASSLWREYGRKIEKVRLQAKRGISNASSEEEIYSIFNNIEWQQ